MVGTWVIPAAGVAGATDSERLLVTLDGWSGRQLRMLAEDLEPVSTVEMEVGVHLFAELMDVEGSGVPQIVLGAGIVGLDGQLIQAYEFEHLLITGWGPFMWPALGEFTGDGRKILVIPAEAEWQAFTAGGDLIARHVVVDERDAAGWYSQLGHTEDGRDYIYLTTRNEYPAEHDFYTRLHKLTLEKNPAYGLSGLPAPGQGGLAPLDGVVLPFGFERVWMREFHTAAKFDAIRFYDLTGDGSDEIIIAHGWHPASETGAFSILDLNGQLLYEHPWSRGGRIAIGDTDGNGVSEVVLLTLRPNWEEGRQFPEAGLSAVEWDGSTFRELYRFELSTEHAGWFLSLCDVTGDGADEILVGLEGESTVDESGSSMQSGVARLLTANGTILWEYRSYFGMPTALIMDDFTGDGTYELIISTTAGQALIFSPLKHPTPEDHWRVFDALLAREKLMPPEGQVAAWLAEVGWEAPASSPGDEDGEPRNVPGIGMPGLMFPVLLGTGALLIAWRARGRPR